MIDLFKVTAEQLFRFKNKLGGLKTLCFQQPYQPKAVYALCNRIFENFDALVELLAAQNIIDDESLRYFIILVLVYEMSQNGLPGRRRPMHQETRQAIQFIKQQSFDEKLLQKLNTEVVENRLTNSYLPPKYFRLNRPFDVSKQQLLQYFEANNVTFEEDQLLPQLFKVQKLNVHYTEQFAAIQSRASCLPAFALADAAKLLKLDLKKLTLLDLTAAPGSKSLQAAQYFGQVIANERDGKRFKILQQRCSQFNNITCVQDDAFILLKDEQFMKQIDVILLDPTCSSSGVFGNSDQKLGAAMQSKKQKADLPQLVKFQNQLLFEALQTKAFGVKLLSYSTCSVNREENEEVVIGALAASNAKLMDGVLQQWPFRSETHPQCLIAGQQAETDGFFAAVFLL